MARREGTHSGAGPLGALLSPREEPDSRMKRSAWFVVVFAIGLTITARVAGADLEGQSGPLAWRATDVQQNTTTVDGKRHARHEFRLTLKNVRADTATLSAYQAAVSYFGIQLNEETGPLNTTLIPGREFAMTLFMLQQCLNDAAALVGLPPVRVGDYFVEHLTGTIGSLAGMPIPIDGILGANFIAAFRVTIDHRGRELRLEPH